MARQNGRDLRIKRGDSTTGVLVAVLNTKTININNSPVDVTGDDDNAFITFLERPGTRQMTIDCSGFTDDETLRDTAVEGTALIEEYTVEWLDAAGSGDVVYSVTGDFFFATFSETGASDGGLEFTAQFQSSGQWTKNVIV